MVQLQLPVQPIILKTVKPGVQEPVSFRRRKRVLFHFGQLYFKSKTTGEISKILKGFGIKNRIMGCGLSGFQRFWVDNSAEVLGRQWKDDPLSFAGHKYIAVAKIEVLTHDPQRARAIIRECGCEFFDEIIGEHCFLGIKR